MMSMTYAREAFASIAEQIEISVAVVDCFTFSGYVVTTVWRGEGKASSWELQHTAPTAISCGCEAMRKQKCLIYKHKGTGGIYTYDLL